MKNRRKTTDYRIKDLEVSPEAADLREGTGISNLDGRLWEEMGSSVGRYFGDEAMVRARVAVESYYLIALSEAGVIRKLKSEEKSALKNLHKKITPKVYRDLRKIEAEARHDVIAMTKIMKKLLSASSPLGGVVSEGWVHWGLASEDVDNLARTSLLINYLNDVYLPEAAKILQAIIALAEKTRNVVIPGKTHLQPALPTVLGKEVALFGLRLSEQFLEIKKLRLRGKLTGAVGTLAAQRFAFPEINWLRFSKNFVESLGLEANPYTTQIEPRARLVELLSKIALVNNILVDLSQDMRIYIGLDWLIQEVKKEEFGSSAMPQKVNPIDFENAQGNALLSNWLIDGLTRVLPVSWLQRDLVDKTILRNLGLPFGYSQISLISSAKGLLRVGPNPGQIDSALNSDWSIIAEGLQSYLRSRGRPEAYETLKALTRGKKLTQSDIKTWIEKLNVEEPIKKDLRRISPKNYLGYSKENFVKMIREIKRTIDSLKIPLVR